MRVPISPPAGLNSDDTTFAPPGVWADGSNVRAWRGKMQIIGGWTDALGGATLTGVCRNVLAWADREAVRNIAFGTHSHLLVSAGGELIDITPAGLTAGTIDGAGGPGYGSDAYDTGDYGESISNEYFARTWSFATSGDFLYANPKNEGIYLYENDGVDAAILTDAPTQVYSILITPERQLLALGCNEEVSNTFNAMCIRGSGIDADYENWDTTDTVTRPFEHILEGGSRIMAARMMGSYVAVWTDTHVHIGQYIGDLGQAYRFDPVASHCGLLGPNALWVANQTAYWITPDLQVYGWQIGGQPQPLACPVLKDFQDNLVRSQGEKVVATGVGKFGEVWFFYPDSRDGIENSRYIAFSVLDGTWFRGELARTAATDAGPTENPLFVSYGGVAYWHELGDTANGAALDWRLRTSALYIDQAQRRGLIRGIWPDFEDQRGPVSLSVYCRDRPQSTERTKGPYALATGQAKKDFMIDARIAEFEFSGSSAPAYMRTGKPSIDVVVTGSE